LAGYAGQQQVERVFRGLKDGAWLARGPTHHWTDCKIRIHAFYCMLGISLLQYVHRQAKAAWSDLSMEQLIEELSRFSSSSCSIHGKARKALTARPMCSRSKPLRSRLWPRRWIWTNCRLPTVGNTKWTP
jgi:hypothetical protein